MQNSAVVNDQLKFDFGDENFEEIASSPLLAKTLYIQSDLQLMAEELWPSLVSKMARTQEREFWNSVRKESAASPSNPTVVGLLAYAKRALLRLAGKKNARISEEICTALDIDKIKEELEADNFNLKYRLELIIDIMARICSPARDEPIGKLKREAQPTVDGLRQVIHVIDSMRGDMCNFLLRYYRQQILDNAVKFERELFNSCLRRSRNVVLVRVREWLQAALADHQANLPEEKRVKAPFTATDVNAVLDTAYRNLLRGKHTYFPESMSLDLQHLRFVNILFVSGVLMACITNLLKKPIEKILPHDAAIEEEIVEMTFPKLSAPLLPISDTTDNEPTGGQCKEDAATTVAHDILALLDYKLKTHGYDKLDAAFRDFFPMKMLQLTQSPTDPVWILFENRLLDPIFDPNFDLKQPTASLHFSVRKLADVVSHIRSVYGRFCSFNRTAHFDYYSSVLASL